MAHAPEHVCASLPKTHLSVHLVWCEVHSAWTLTQHVYQEDGDDIRDVVPFTEVGFGPFDGPEDVLAVVSALLRLGGLQGH